MDVEIVLEDINDFADRPVEAGVGIVLPDVDPDEVADVIRIRGGLWDILHIRVWGPTPISPMLGWIQHSQFATSHRQWNIKANWLENTEYEPDQFPAVIYRPPPFAVTLLIFSTGNVIIGGTIDRDEARSALQHIEDKIAQSAVI